MPEIIVDCEEDVPELMPDADDDDEEEEEAECIEEGDRVFAANLLPEREEIRATANIDRIGRS